ncbi:hypothetical protein BBP00_00007931 [Phytophthora kernoviae]|uniref:Uncharacterized protein n=1 Tax=Phytophthora kernoviae TaxID=325452 RepID=A0A3F2RGT0_9STRA|nr:hypothetical protein BBP00_00007931 [Phytophthora kernoviae]
MKVRFLHCSALEIPGSLRDFNRLGEIVVYNSTIVDWGANAAVTNVHHPVLTKISIVRGNMSDGVLPLGLQSRDFPLSVVEINFCETNLQYLPDDLDLKWHPGSIIDIENSQLIVVPPVLMQLQPYYLVIGGNPITVLPPEIFEIEGTLLLTLGRTQEEKKILERQLHGLNAQLQHLARRREYAKRREGFEARKKQNQLLRSSILGQRVIFANTQSMMSEFLRGPDHSRNEPVIRLGTDLRERYNTLIAMKQERLYEITHFLTERSRYMTMDTDFTDLQRFQAANGDVCLVRFDIKPFHQAQSVKQAFEGVLKFSYNMEISISDLMGDITVRENDDVDWDSSVAQHRLVTSITPDVKVDTNNVTFTQYWGDSSGPQVERTVGDELGLAVCNYVEEGALYPYRESERELERLEAHMAQYKQQNDTLETRQKLEQQGEENRTMRQAIHTQRLAFANTQSMISQFMRVQEHSPFETFIQLGKDPVERHTTLLSMKRRKLHDALQFLVARRMFMDPSKAFSDNQKFENIHGDYCYMGFDITPFVGVQNPKTVFDELLNFSYSLEISLSELLGDITIRENDDHWDPSVAQQKLVTNVANLAEMETNTAMFSEYHERGGPAALGVNLPFNAEDLGALSHGEELGVLACDYVNEDELYPYMPDRRIRQDVTVLMLVSTFQHPAAI